MEDQDGSERAEMRKQHEHTIASATKLVEKWTREENVAVGTKKGAEAREKRLEAEQVRKDAQVAMSQLGEEEKWLVDGTKWFAGRSHGSKVLRRPRPDQPPPPKSSTALALLCICIIIAASIAGIIAMNTWLLGGYNTLVDGYAGAEAVDEPTSTFMPCRNESSQDSVFCVPRSECGSEATHSEACMVVV
jgi:hypothetical protein